MDAVLRNKNHLELLLRGAMGLCALTTFATSTVVTGIASGDFAFLLSYTLLLYTAFYVVFVLRQKTILLELRTKGAIDGGFGLLLFLAAIWLIASRAFTYCTISSCAGAYACVVFLFVGAFIQGASVYLVYTQLYRRDSIDTTSIESPAVLQ
ncbi:hypothetical protein SDRG_11296 [Saprolegnia diclina VS20]|uniref:MARVEL domain-containing protein n=1 Tax=Saprolegnia diclina (strain VS20) TaxID=1156394 RepID=T0Q8Y2_SAPDV|nr:hypothetical protein SDRG_11296 [Saprolegnia diclina VS20]EQC31111.1 hypothetical protein SDRG_11296 [Saprolegnia diclina VS20]|eukprot:XP_008615550.1 hypothetical protein SDRG_11296 [Saprolegnia diclina VS20]